MHSKWPDGRTGGAEWITGGMARQRDINGQRDKRQTGFIECGIEQTALGNDTGNKNSKQANKNKIPKKNQKKNQQQQETNTGPETRPKRREKDLE